MTSFKYNESDDATLWVLLLKGNTGILETLYRRYYDLLFNYGMKFHPDEELIKDCIQNLFVKLHKSNSLNETTSVRSYLLRSLKNILFDKLKATRETISIHDYPFSIPVEDQTFEQLFPQDDQELKLSKQLMKAYSQLPENQKQAIYLRYIKGLSYKEIAEITEVNVQSSMNSVSRALTKLRSLISEYKVLLFFFLLSE